MNIERGLVKTRLGYLHYRAAGTPGNEAIFLQHINQKSSALYLELMAVLCPALRVVTMDYPSHGVPITSNRSPPSAITRAAWLSLPTR